MADIKYAIKDKSRKTNAHIIIKNIHKTPPNVIPIKLPYGMELDLPIHLASHFKFCLGCRHMGHYQKDCETITSSQYSEQLAKTDCATQRSRHVEPSRPVPTITKVKRATIEEASEILEVVIAVDTSGQIVQSVATNTVVEGSSLLGMQSR